MRTYSPLFLSLCLLAAISGAAIGQAKNNVPDVIPGAPKSGDLPAPLLELVAKMIAMPCLDRNDAPVR